MEHTRYMHAYKIQRGLSMVSGLTVASESLSVKEL